MRPMKAYLNLHYAHSDVAGQIMFNKRKGPLCNIQAMNDQISWRIPASLVPSAYKFNGYYWTHTCISTNRDIHDQTAQKCKLTVAFLAGIIYKGNFAVLCTFSLTVKNYTCNAGPCENGPCHICGQRRPTSACAFEQADQDFRCLIIE